MPSSRITATASGRTRLGCVPALLTSKRSPASWRNRPSAIWLRAEFPVQRMRMRFLASTRLLPGGGYDHVESILWKRGHEPSKKQRCGHRTSELRQDKARSIGRPDARKSIGSGAGQRYGGVGKRRRRREQK